MKILNKEIIKNYKDNQKYSYFYNHGDIPLEIKLKLELDNNKEIEVSLYLETNGDVEIESIDEDSFDEIADTRYIQENFENDEELREFLKGKEIRHNNWFDICIEIGKKIFYMDNIITIDELLCCSNDELLKLIKKYI